MCGSGQIKTILITGGIGSGKSEFSRLLSEKGVPVYDCDSRTKTLYDKDKELLHAISEAVGADICTENGSLDKKKLGDIIFSDNSKLASLEAVVHPRVMEDFIRWRESQLPRCGYVAMESAIALEKPAFYSLADYILVVDAPVSVRLQRACRRDGVDRSCIEARMDKQILLNEISKGKVPERVDFVIVNDGTLEDLSNKTDNFLSLIFQ